jgi:hypothetical protein
MVAVGTAGVGGPARLGGGEPGQSQSEGVGGNVAGVGEQGQRPRPETSGQLYRDNGKCECQRQPQRTVGGSDPLLVRSFRAGLIRRLMDVDGFILPTPSGALCNFEVRER